MGDLRAVVVRPETIATRRPRRNFCLYDLGITIFLVVGVSLMTAVVAG